MDAREVLRRAIDDIAGSVDWDRWPDELLAALDAAGFAVVNVMPHEALKGLKPLVVYFRCDEDRDEFIAAIQEVKPNMRTIKI